MQYKSVQTLVFGVLFATLLIAERDLRADGITEIALEDKVRALLGEGKVFEKADKMSAFIQTGDDSFYNIEEKTVESLVRERFVEDSNALVGDAWTAEAKESRNWTYSLDDDNERFILRSKGLLHSDGFNKPEASENQIRNKALRDLSSLGMQKVGDLELDIRRLMLTTVSEDGKIDNRAVAYKVFVYKKIGDVLVRGPRTVMTYLNDGRLQKILLKWPSVEYGSVVLQRTKSNDEIVKVVAQEIRKNGMAEAEKLQADVSYIVKDGRLRMITVVTGQLQGPDDSHFLRDIEIEI